jgi:hypothetical protein
MALSLRPMQWANLPELHQAPPLDESDLGCLEEVRAALARHGKLSRFALHLAHRHFDLAPGEILIECPDPDGRTQHVTVGSIGVSSVVWWAQRFRWTGSVAAKPMGGKRNSRLKDERDWLLARVAAAPDLFAAS